MSRFAIAYVRARVDVSCDGHHASIFLQKFFLLDFHQNDVRADFFDTAERNHVFTVRPEHPADFPWSRYDDFFDFPATNVKLQVHDASKAFPVADIDDFLVTHFA